ncbi:MAG TPA: DUF1508 domain-containing protein [Kofleriaceae bacterium]|nr:DUF1508 domain-containing protein [Kofleriaceae bacterium]
MKTSSIATALLLAAFALAPTLTACTEADPIDDSSGSTSEEIGARARFDLWKDSGSYVFQFVSAAGETLVDSQDYSSRTAALNGLVSVMDNGAQESRYTVVAGADGKAHFELHATNGQVIGTSQVYASKADAGTAVKAAVASLAAYPRHWESGTGARFEIRTDAGGKYFFNLHATNGETVLHSERYDTLAAALNGAYSVTDNGTTSARYQVLTANDGTVYLNLTATNGQIIATSETYATKASALRARDAIIALVPRVSVL